MPGHQGQGDGALVEMDKEMWTEYLSGLTMSEIGLAHGVHLSTVSRAIGRYRDSLGQETIDNARKLDLARADALMERHWHKAVRTGSIDHGKLVLGLLKYRARALGYEAPKRGDVTVHHEVTVTHRLAEVRQRNADRLETVPGELVRLDEHRDADTA